jgi:hypothetical protein
MLKYVCLNCEKTFEKPERSKPFLFCNRKCRADFEAKSISKRIEDLRHKKGYKNSGYSILALILMPLIVCYLTIRSLFWFHILIINGHDVLYESTPGLSFCIVCSIGLVLSAVWFAFAEGITTCYKDEVE